MRRSSPRPRDRPHRRGNSDPADLRLLCQTCHIGVTLSHGRHAPAKSDAEIDAVFAVITGRVDSPAPARACDTADWMTAWRTWTLQHAEA